MIKAGPGRTRKEIGHSELRTPLPLLGEKLQFSMQSNKESLLNMVQRQESVHLKTS